MADKGQQWHIEFQKLVTESNKAQTDLQRWELLGSAATTKGGGGERSKLGADIRVRILKLKQDIERLKSQLDTLPQSEATQKTITQWRDEVAAVSKEIQEAHQRVTRKTGSVTSTTSTSFNSDLPSTSSFAGPNAEGPRSSGAELQPVSNRALLESQKQAMRDIEESLTPLEGTVNNLHHVGNMIHREITEQNTMLQNTNDQTDRVASRMSRLRAMVARVGEQDKTRCLGCTVVVLFVILIFLVVKLLIA